MGFSKDKVWIRFSQAIITKLSPAKISSKKLRLLIYSDWFGSVQFGSVGFDLVFVWIWFRFSF